MARIQIDLPDEKEFKQKIAAKAATVGRTRKNYIENLVITDVYGQGVVVPRQLGRAARLVKIDNGTKQKF